jgi:hypothetical protein
MTKRMIPYLKPVASLAALGLLAACSSDLTGGNRHMVRLSFATRSSVSPSVNGVATDLITGTGDNQLVIKSVQLVLGKIELDRVGTADCVGEIENEEDNQGRVDVRDGDDDAGRMDEECEEVQRDPLLINVPIDDQLHPEITVPLAPGTFRELEAKLEPARDKFTTFNAANPNLVGKSVRVEGTFGSAMTPFVFTSSVRAKLEMGFDPPLVIDDNTKNATVNIDVRNWFLTSSGAVIDPNTATTGSNNLLVIENNIRRSFHAFQDDDERGEDHHDGNDDGGHH